MADNFQQFSEVVSAITAEQRAWIELVLGCQEDVQSVLALAGFNLQAIELNYWPDFLWEFGKPDELWLHGDEYGNVSHVAEFVRVFLARYRPDQFWQLTWSNTCSRPRVGEFGGGGVFVTAKAVKFWRAADWVDQQCEKFKRRALAAPR